MKKFLSLVIASFAIITLSHASSWKYTGKTGPANWGHNSIICKIGKNQSPINILTNNLININTNKLDINYLGQTNKVIDNGHTIKVSVSGVNTFRYGGVSYKLAQFHFHSPSENTINGRHYPLELHFVNTDKRNNIAVIAVMFKIGRYNQYLSKILQDLTEKSNRLTKSFNINKLIPLMRGYLEFNGSLTTPPCSEGVHWLILKSLNEASSKQILEFRKIMGKNNRPIQALNARFVLSVK